MQELTLKKEYILSPKYKGGSYPKLFKAEASDITETTYMIKNLDDGFRQTFRITKEEFYKTFNIIETIDVPHKLLYSEVIERSNRYLNAQTNVGGYVPLIGLGITEFRPR